MAASAIDEAVRNCIAVGADPRRIAILDNFCWGYTDRAETLGSLVRAALACRDVAIGLGTPFISGKDSLNNEFSYTIDGQKKTISIPPSLLISALGQIDDVSRCVTMDLKRPGNLLYLVGTTRDEMGGSHFNAATGLAAGNPPSVDVPLARKTFAASAPGHLPGNRARVPRSERRRPGSRRSRNGLCRRPRRPYCSEPRAADAGRVFASRRDGDPAFLRVQHAIPLRSAAGETAGVREHCWPVSHMPWWGKSAMRPSCPSPACRTRKRPW